jgi:hypothetical protein
MFRISYFKLHTVPLALVVGLTTLLVGVLFTTPALAVEGTPAVDTPVELEVTTRDVVEATTLLTEPEPKLELEPTANTFPALAQSPSPLTAAGYTLTSAVLAHATQEFHGPSKALGIQLTPL